MLPLAARTAQDLAHWLGPAWPGDLRLEPDLDRIEALTAERGELWARVGAADFLTRDEKRAAVGYGAEGGKEQQSQKYSPDQPRVTAGRSDGGQWTAQQPSTQESNRELDSSSEGEDLHAIGSNEYSIDLHDEEAAGGHTIERHVGQTDYQIAKRLESLTFRGVTSWRAPEGIGTFTSLGPARKFIESTLNMNFSNINAFVNEAELGAKLIIDQNFNMPTGREAYREDAYGPIYIRSTDAVRVVIERSEPRNGFNVLTAFPRRAKR